MIYHRLVVILTMRKGIFKSSVCLKNVLWTVLLILIFGRFIGYSSHTFAELNTFVSLKSSEVNMRVGPGKEYPVSWVFMRARLPMLLIAEFDQWRKLKFWDGTTGWIHKNMVSSKNFAIVLKEDTVMYKHASEKYPIAKLEKGVIVPVLKKEEEFTKVEIGKLKGWVKKDSLWGVNDE